MTPRPATVVLTELARCEYGAVGSRGDVRRTARQEIERVLNERLWPSILGRRRDGEVLCSVLERVERVDAAVAACWLDARGVAAVRALLVFWREAERALEDGAGLLAGGLVAAAVGVEVVRRRLQVARHLAVVFLEHVRELPHEAGGHANVSVLSTELLLRPGHRGRGGLWDRDGRARPELGAHVEVRRLRVLVGARVRVCGGVWVLAAGVWVLAAGAVDLDGGEQAGGGVGRAPAWCIAAAGPKEVPAEEWLLLHLGLLRRVRWCGRRRSVDVLKVRGDLAVRDEVGLATLRGAVQCCRVAAIARRTAMMIDISPPSGTSIPRGGVVVGGGNEGHADFRLHTVQTLAISISPPHVHLTGKRRERPATDCSRTLSIATATPPQPCNMERIAAAQKVLEAVSLSDRRTFRRCGHAQAHTDPSQAMVSQRSLRTC